MTSYRNAHDWLLSMDLKVYAGATFFVLCIVASTVFGVLPHGSLVYINALVSGSIWMICVATLVLGGKRVDLWDTTSAALIAGGLTTSIPSLFADDSLVAWGSTFSRVGFAMLAIRWVYNIVMRIRAENEAAEEKK